MKNNTNSIKTFILLVICVVMGVMCPGSNRFVVCPVYVLDTQDNIPCEQIALDSAEEAAEEPVEAFAYEITESAGAEVAGDAPVTDTVAVQEQIIDSFPEEPARDIAEEAPVQDNLRDSETEAEDYTGSEFKLIPSTDTSANGAVSPAELAEIINPHQVVAAESAVRGNYARLYINSVGVDVAVFYTGNINIFQSIVDARDSACMFDWYDGNTMIADHCNQGFESIKSCCVGTYAELITPSGIMGYTCEAIIYDGWNRGDYLAFNDGTPIGSCYTNSLIMYTCNSNGTVTITVWG